MTALNAFKTTAPQPRNTLNLAAGQEQPHRTEEQQAVEEAIVKVLMRFPEAYQAVLDETRRLEEARNPQET